jgi:hypothetical protein
MPHFNRTLVKTSHHPLITTKIIIVICLASISYLGELPTTSSSWDNGAAVLGCGLRNVGIDVEGVVGVSSGGMVDMDAIFASIELIGTRLELDASLYSATTSVDFLNTRQR